jgi:hypothetical protein
LFIRYWAAFSDIAGSEDRTTERLIEDSNKKAISVIASILTICNQIMLLVLLFNLSKTCDKTSSYEILESYATKKFVSVLEPRLKLGPTEPKSASLDQAANCQNCLQAT